jgi:hypothetical protein
MNFVIEKQQKTIENIPKSIKSQNLFQKNPHINFHISPVLNLTIFGLRGKYEDTESLRGSA